MYNKRVERSVFLTDLERFWETIQGVVFYIKVKLNLVIFIHGKLQASQSRASFSLARFDLYFVVTMFFELNRKLVNKLLQKL